MINKIEMDHRPNGDIYHNQPTYYINSRDRTRRKYLTKIPSCDKKQDSSDMFLAKIMQHGNQFFQLTIDNDVIDIYIKLLEDAILKYNLIYDGCKKKFNSIPLQSVFNNTNALIENSVLSDEVQELFKPLFIAYQKIGTILGMIKNDSSLPDEFYESISGEVFLKGIGRYIEPIDHRTFLGVVDPSLTISFDY